jgi:hypothetical protein
VQQASASHARLILEVFRTHKMTHQSVHFSQCGIGPSHRFLSGNTQCTRETGIHASGGIRTRNPSKQSSADPHLYRSATGMSRYIQLQTVFCVTLHECLPLLLLSYTQSCLSQTDCSVACSTKEVVLTKL